MKLSTALRLGRVSNLPTVTSNVLAAIALAGRHPSPFTILLVCVAMSAMYVAGMYLNDAFDRDYDRVQRPERPIPSGEVTAAAVFDAGFAMLAGGIVLVGATAFVTGAGWKPLLSAVALGSLIIFYDANHKENPLSPFVMGLCRAGVYTTAALVVRSSLCLEVAIGCALLVSYLIGLTYAARQENLSALPRLWPLAFLSAPFVVARPYDGVTLAIYAVFLLWVGRAFIMMRMRMIKQSVGDLIAGISLLDALLAAEMHRPWLALVAAASFLATRRLQKLIPGT